MLVDKLKLVEAQFKDIGFPSSSSVLVLILERGMHFNPLSKPRPKGVRKGKNNLCYKTSTDMVIKDSSLIYCEGYALIEGIDYPFAHAWVSNDKHEVIETTWKTSGSEYFGIPFDRNYLLTSLFEKGAYGLLDPYYDRSILKVEPRLFLHPTIEA
jgi:hypothetical protein